MGRFAVLLSESIDVDEPPSFFAIDHADHDEVDPRAGWSHERKSIERWVLLHNLPASIAATGHLPRLGRYLRRVP